MKTVAMANGTEMSITVIVDNPAAFSVEPGLFVTSHNGDLGYITRTERGEVDSYVWIDWLSGCQTEHRVRELLSDDVYVATLKDYTI